MKWYEDPVYLKMCKKAPEIQELWKPAIGDWFYKEDGIGYGLWLVCKIEHDSLFCSGQRMNEPPFTGEPVRFLMPENYVWLPHQDQLQEMVRDNFQRQYLMLVAFSSFCVDDMPDDMSMEQLWFAFVMKEKYNKFWNGEDWLKEGFEVKKQPTASRKWTDIYCPILQKTVDMSICPWKCNEYITDHCIISNVVERWLSKKEDKNGTK